MVTNNITDKNTLKGWFKRGLKPLETQFHGWMDSYWHKDEKIPSGSVDGLEATLNNKAETSTVEEIFKEFGVHEINTAVHKTAEEQSKLDHLAEDPDATYATKEEVQAESYLLELDHNDSVDLLKEKFAPVVKRVLRGHVFDILVKYHYSGALYYMYHVKYVDGQRDSEIEFRGELFSGSVGAEVVGMKSFCISVKYDEEYNIVEITPVSRATDSFLLTKDAVRDTLDSDSRDYPLSAAQGKILKGTIDEVAGKVGQIEVNSDVYIATFDCSLGEDKALSSMLATFQDFYDRGVLFSKPVYLRFQWKTDYTTENAEAYEFLVQGVYHAERVNELVFSSPVKVVLANDPRHPIDNLITIGITAERKVEVVELEWYPKPVDESMVFLLYENGDGAITMTDSDYSGSFYRVWFGAWDKLVNAMKSGDKRIVIMLKTKDSGIYCPASYQLKWNEEAKGFEGKLSIQYLKEMERVQYWCVDEYVFDGRNGYLTGTGSLYGDFEYLNNELVHWIKRYALNVPEVVRLVIDLKDMDDLDGIQSEAIENSLYDQAEKVVDWSKTVELLLLDGNVTGSPAYTATLISREHLNSSLSNSLNLVFKIPENLQDRLQKALKLTIRIRKDTGIITLRIGEDPLENPEIFHLYEDNDGFISLQDLRKNGDWSLLDQELKRGNLPAVYLCSPTSEYECPVRYTFSKSADGNLPGMMEIFYPKNVDGQWQLWIERRHFFNGCGHGTIYDGNPDSTVPEIIKFNLPDLSYPNVELVSEYPADLSPYAEGTIFIKLPVVGYCRLS